jgi:tetratricopeptide (TPR) repeat protein
MIRLNHIRSAVNQLLVWLTLLLAGVVRVPAQPSNSPGVLPLNPPPDLSASNQLTTAQLDRFNYLLSTARFGAGTRDFIQAEANYVKLLTDDVPLDLQKTALFELAQIVQTQNELTRAQAIFTQYVQRWPADERMPEINLHQGQIFRQMGLSDLALTKFYAVMTAALALKNDQLPFFKRLVLQAQVEIAETHYLVGKYKDAADYYARLLKQDDPALDHAQIQFRLIRSLGAVKQYEEAATQAQDFLSRYPDAADAPEVRYDLAQAFKGQGRNAEALQQVLIFLKEERSKTLDHPEVWTYWQQRVGNEIANELYQEGDYVKALEVYQTLVKLDPTLQWQLPVRYQVAITYEKLLQPVEAIAAYRAITNAAPNLGTNSSPGLKSVVEMARWRLNFLEWQNQAAEFNQTSRRATFISDTNLILTQK